VAIGEDARPLSEHIVAEIAYHAVDAVDGGRELWSRYQVVEGRCQCLEVHPGAEQRLDHALVEVVRDALALAQHGQAIELVPCPAVLQRD
jgi:hypothetical protein